MFRKITRKNLEAFLARHTTDEKTLDIGAGGSSYSRYFPNRVTIDIDPARAPDVVGDAHALPFAEGEFPMILCTEVLEHLIDPPKAIAEMHRVLRSGGTLILTTRFVYPIHDAPHDYWRFTKYGLQELFKEWDIIELTPETRSFSALAVLIQRLALQARFHLNALVKLKLYITAWLFDRLNFLIREEYGDIRKERGETNIMTSGYYLVCRKK